MRSRARPRNALNQDQHRLNVLLALGWYAGPLHQGVAQFARDAGWILNIDALRGGFVPEMAGADGIIFVHGANPAIDEAVHRLNLPTVSIGPVPHPRYPNIVPDNRAIGALAADHFRARGFRHFAFYLRWGTLGEQVRMEAFQNQLGAWAHSFHRIDADAAGDIVKHNSTNRLRWLAERIQALPKPLAVMAEFDDHAIEVIQACVGGGIPIPEQVAVLGVDNDPLRCDFAPVPLSSVDDNQIAQGFAAAVVLQQLMNGQPAPQHTTLIAPAGLTTRKSTDILAIQNPYVAAALKVIWEHYTEPLTAEDVAQTVPLSHRRLHDLFQQHVGRTMSQEIARRRIEHAIGLLRDPMLKMEEIARRSGFSSADRMARVFRRVKHRTPAAYRRLTVAAESAGIS